jgi:hypothetical protein
MPSIVRQRRGRSPALAAFRAVTGAVAISAACAAGAVAAESWTTYRNDRFGYTLTYPSSVFQPDKTSKDGGGQVFLNQQGNAKVVVNGAVNDEGFTPTEYRKTILKEFAGYDQLDYSPQGQTWFVLSGYRGDAIYYQKVMFSCGGKVINALSVTFPRAEKPFYEGLVERMEDNFKPGSGEGCRRD